MKTILICLLLAPSLTIAGPHEDRVAIEILQRSLDKDNAEIERLDKERLRARGYDSNGNLSFSSSSKMSSDAWLFLFILGCGFVHAMFSKK